MNAAIVIPARYESSRFQGKPLADIAGKSMIHRVWLQCCKAASRDCIFVTTDNKEIENHCLDFGMQVIMTSDKCKTGTDRVYEAIRDMQVTTVVNVQGDEPAISPKDIQDICRMHHEDPSMVYCGMAPIKDEARFRNPSVPKIVTNQNGDLLYASRSPIPTSKSLDFHKAQQQVCVYAFSPGHLLKFYNSQKTPMESIEDIEILRFLEIGIKVRMVNITPTVAIDHKVDIKKCLRFMISRYKTWLFDCDGVILDSNKLKSDAFYEIALPYGKGIAESFVDYHKRNGGVSRFDKIKTLWEDMLEKNDGMDAILEQYGEICYTKLMECNTTPGFSDFLKSIKNCGKFVVSGGKETELKSVFQSRSMSSDFNGIYGSPTSKMQIVRNMNFERPAVLIGDSKYDYEVSRANGLSFIFMSAFTEFSGWQDYFRNKDVMIISDFRDIL